MTSKLRTEIEWIYEPDNFFESPFITNTSEYDLTVSDGMAMLKFTVPQERVSPDREEFLTKELESIFQTRGLLIHRPYKLHGARVNQYSPDGIKHVHVLLGGEVIGLSGASADFVIRDRDGNVISDTKAERIEEETNIVKAITAKIPTSSALRAAIASYSAAVTDPDNELVHLYEIRDAFAKELGGETPAKSVLGISHSKWSRFGQLCNALPLRQARHRGRSMGDLRDATPSELDEARKIAFAMIKSYANYLA